MSGKLRLNGATSGYSELQAPDVAGDQTFTLPAVGGELVTKQSGGSVVGYQQGLWTPTINEGTAEFEDCWWHRTGNSVTLNAMVKSISATSTTIITIGGVPYGIAVKSTGSCMVDSANNAAHTTFANSSDSLLRFYRSATASGDSWRAQTFNDQFANKAVIRSTVTYQTDDTTWTPINGATIS